MTTVSKIGNYLDNQSLLEPVLIGLTYLDGASLKNQIVRRKTQAYEEVEKNPEYEFLVNPKEQYKFLKNYFIGCDHDVARILGIVEKNNTYTMKYLRENFNENLKSKSGESLYLLASTMNNGLGKETTDEADIMRELIVEKTSQAISNFEYRIEQLIEKIENVQEADKTHEYQTEFLQGAIQDILLYLYRSAKLKGETLMKLRKYKEARSILLDALAYTQELPEGSLGYAQIEIQSSAASCLWYMKEYVESHGEFFDLRDALGDLGREYNFLVSGGDNESSEEDIQKIEEFNAHYLALQINCIMVSLDDPENEIDDVLEIDFRLKDIEEYFTRQKEVSDGILVGSDEMLLGMCLFCRGRRHYKGPKKNKALSFFSQLDQLDQNKLKTIIEYKNTLLENGELCIADFFQPKVQPRPIMKVIR